jgi:hypothetical protein
MPYKDPDKRRKAHRINMRQRRGHEVDTGSRLYHAVNKVLELIPSADQDDLMFEWKRINNAFDQRFAKNQHH